MQKYNGDITSYGISRVGISAENNAYQHGNAIFQIIDHICRGGHGKCGQTYAARQLPNSYATKLKPAHAAGSAK